MQYKICVDRDAAREDADYLEEQVIEADNPDEALEKAGENINVAIATLGEEGSLMYNNNEFIKSEAFKVNAMDTTGAGDNYAAGFLYMYGIDSPLIDCMNAGSLCASETIKFLGARPTSNLKNLLIENKIIKN